MSTCSNVFYLRLLECINLRYNCILFSLTVECLCLKEFYLSRWCFRRWQCTQATPNQPLDRLTNTNVHTIRGLKNITQGMYAKQKKNGLKAWPLYEFNTATAYRYSLIADSPSYISKTIFSLSFQPCCYSQNVY